MTDTSYSKNNSGDRNPTDEMDLESALHGIGGNEEDLESDYFADDLDDDLDDLDDESTIDDYIDPDLDDLETSIDVDELPQEITESYGTGVQELPGYTIGGRTMREHAHELNSATPELTGGDIDANYEQAEADGDESVGGTVSTPDMDIVDDLGKAVGLEMSDFNFLHTNDILERRDDRRWELEPRSSEDYDDRRDDDDDYGSVYVDRFEDDF